MKKTYEPPVAEKVEFCYEEQVVASGNGCITTVLNTGIDDPTSCNSGDRIEHKLML